VQEWGTKRVIKKPHPHMVTREPTKLPKNDPASLELQRMNGLLQIYSPGAVALILSASQVTASERLTYAVATLAPFVEDWGVTIDQFSERVEVLACMTYICEVMIHLNVQI
jgi:hypothetical protein